MKRVQSFRGDPTGRQAAEAIKIRETPEELQMNSKDEFRQPDDIKESYELNNGTWKEKMKLNKTKKIKEEFRQKIIKKLKEQEILKSAENSNENESLPSSWNNDEKRPNDWKKEE